MSSIITIITIAIIAIAIALFLNEAEDIQEDVARAKYLEQKHCSRYTANIKIHGKWIIISHGRWSKCWKAARKAAEEVGGASIWVFPARQ